MYYIQMISPDELFEGHGVERLRRRGDLSRQGRARLARRSTDALIHEIFFAVQGLKVARGVGVGTQTAAPMVLLPFLGRAYTALPISVSANAVCTNAPRDDNEGSCVTLVRRHMVR